MNIIVVGCGKIGRATISSLVSEGHDVTAIDNDESVLTEISNIYDVMSICANGAECESLKEANVSDCDLFIAVTGSDESNMLSCFMAKKLGAKHTFARVRNPEYNTSLSFMRQHLELDASINPELMVAREIYNILKFPSAIKVETFSSRNLEMVDVKLKANSALDGIVLSELREKYNSQVLVCAVQRADEVIIPDGNFVLKSGDKITITASPADINKFLRKAGILQKRVNDVMIVGGSKTAYYLSKMLLNLGISVKIIDKDKSRCEVLSEILPNAVIINGNGTEQELLLEEGLDTTDAFVSLTGIDEENILISIFASSLDVAKIVTKVNKKEMANMAEKLNLDCVVSPRTNTSDVLVRYARALQNSMGSNVETLYKILDGKAEALEFNVNADSSFTNVAFKDLKTKSNILIAGIVRGRKLIIPSGDDIIQKGDKVIVIATNQILNDLSDILA